MKKRELVVLAISVFMVALLIGSSGCIGQKKDEPKKEAAITGGLKGVSAAFVAGAPLDPILVNDPFEVIVTLKNEGGYDIEKNQAAVFLHGIDFASYSVAEGGSCVYNASENRLEEIIGSKLGKATLGADGAISPGDSYDASFGPQCQLTRKAIAIPEGGKGADTFLATFCYRYQSKDKSRVCLGTKGKETTGEEGCIPGAASKPEAIGVGAPIRAAGVSASPVSNGFRFNIDIKNVGGGTVFLVEPSGSTSGSAASGSATGVPNVGTLLATTIPLAVGIGLSSDAEALSQWRTCMELSPADLNKVKVISIKIGEKKICGDVTSVRLNSEGIGTIRCSETMETLRAGAPYWGDLIVELDYNYKAQISKKVTIEHAG